MTQETQLRFTDRARAFADSFFEGTANAPEDIWLGAQGAANYIRELADQVDDLQDILRRKELVLQDLAAVIRERLDTFKCDVEDALMVLGDSDDPRYGTRCNCGNYIAELASHQSCFEWEAQKDAEAAQ